MFSGASGREVVSAKPLDSGRDGCQPLRLWEGFLGHPVSPGVLDSGGDPPTNHCSESSFALPGGPWIYRADHSGPCPSTLWRTSTIREAHRALLQRRGSRTYFGGPKGPFRLYWPCTFWEYGIGKPTPKSDCARPRRVVSPPVGVFQYMCRKWGTPGVVLLVSRLNRKVPCFWPGHGTRGLTRQARWWLLGVAIACFTPSLLGSFFLACCAEWKPRVFINPDCPRLATSLSQWL